MTPLLPELEAFPLKGVFDGELIAFSDGQPDFVALYDRMLLHSDVRIPIAFVAFDVPSIEGTNTMRELYLRRREMLESLDLVGSHWITTPSFSDGESTLDCGGRPRARRARREAARRRVQAWRARLAESQEQGALEVRGRTRGHVRPLIDMNPALVQSHSERGSLPAGRRQA